MKDFDERKTHGMSNKPEYRAWGSMRSRCSNPQHKSFHNYGGRGIKVCEEWSSFQRFYEDMGPRPSPRHSIDRIDNNGNYEPGNCRWTTYKIQNNNHRANRLVTNIDGVTRTVSEWADELGISRSTIYSRLRLGFPIDKVLSPKNHRIAITDWDKVLAVLDTGLSQYAVARIFNVTQATISHIKRSSRGV